MKKTLISLAVASALLVSSVGVLNKVNADDNNTGAAANVNTKTYNDGTNNADVQVNGTLGGDNTNTDSNIPEGSDKWINITLDTATIFYNTSNDSKILSPTYNITNNSGRPVNVSVNSFKQNDSTDISKVAELNLSVKRSDGTTASNKLIENGKLSNNKTNLLTLANVNGNLTNNDTAVSGNNKATFTYNGSLSNKLTSTINPSFTMNPLFTPVSW
ncbi:hypothetical protein [Fructobacillus papyrifericola]|uniref:Uncharacterized protein n=1 Tax=Fructobacillus papyrifericola TaxID=2713172 RepID=A0ABS5QU74_9LACO|nr:hypothetical protein [Fructobacillus papyrifericola]MBS9336745.1 hypothetical protein [Fructobacillus papyrifericola]